MRHRSRLLRPSRTLLALALLVTACTVDANVLAGEAGDPPPSSTNSAATESGAADPSDPADPTATPPPTPTETAGDGESADLEPSLIGAAGVGDIYYPGYGNGGYDVISYDLEIGWDNDASVMDATVLIELTTTQDLARFNLDFAGMTVLDITVDDEPATWNRDGRELQITPASTLAEGATALVIVAYEGTPQPLGTPGSPFSDGWKDLGDTIIALGEPTGSAGWYPVNEHPTDKATYRISVTTDSSLVVASNGIKRSEEDNGDGTTTWIYQTDDPQASYLTTLGIGDFRFHQGTPSRSGVPVRHWFHEDVYDESVATMARTGDMIDVFEGIFGEYPFELYGSMVVEEDLGFALETQTLSVFGADLIDGGGRFERIVAHELAHQWFGNHVSLGQWRDIWLNEGFATYSEFLWAEASQPGYDLDRAIRQSYENFGFILDTPPAAPPVDDLFAASVYMRGAFTLHALRTTVGDDVFFRTINTWVAEYGGTHAETSDFIRLAEDLSGLDLGEFFDEWLFAPELPPLPS